MMDLTPSNSVPEAPESLNSSKCTVISSFFFGNSVNVKN